MLLLMPQHPDLDPSYYAVSELLLKLDSQVELLRAHSRMSFSRSQTMYKYTLLVRVLEAFRGGVTRA
jgi:hypothetical protein